MTVSIVGNNTFAIKQRLDELVGKFLAKYGELGIERLDADEVEVERAIESILALPFLSQRKMVVLRSVSTNKELAERIEQIFSSIPETTDLIIYEPLTDRRTAFYKTLKAETRLEEYPELDSKDLAKWLVAETKKAGGEISLPNAGYMVERLGTNQQLLYNEIQKLVTYNKKIERENIDLLTEPTPQSKVFDLLDAAFAGRKRRALELYEDQRAQKVEPEMILAMIAWQLQLLTLVKFANGKRAGEIAKDTGMNPYPINKAAGLANRLSDQRLKSMVDEALEIDIRGKTTAFDMDEALKTYITTL